MRDGRRPQDLQSGDKPKDERSASQDANRPDGGDPRQRNEQDGTGQRDPDGTAPPSEGDPDGWKVRLPAELRDAAANGQWDRIPPRYRSVVERYYRWLQEQRAAEGTSPR